MNEGTSEGEVCGRDGCPGVLEFQPVKNCTCFLSPPCSACLDNPLTCPVCGWSSDDE